MNADHHPNPLPRAQRRLDPQPALIALRRAGALAREEAVQSNTAIIVRDDNGQLVRITADELRANGNAGTAEANQP